MAQPKPQLSIAMPEGFDYNYTQGQYHHVPQTPAPPPHQPKQDNSFEHELGDSIQPPPPPRQTFKIRRRRVDNTNATAATAAMTMSESTAVPTIESPTSNINLSSGRDAMLTSGYLAPRPSYLRLLSPPKTPASQVKTYTGEEDDAQSSEWTMFHHVHGNLIQRPFSACSDFSDSSASSFGSSNAFSLGGGSCTSPESDAADPFSFYELKSGPVSGPTLPSSSDMPTAKRAKTRRHPKWTPEMDNHLWITYMIYVQDPRVTPFKMLPGTAPPLGVCHRVAREARRSWKGCRASPGDRILPRISVHLAGSPTAPRFVHGEEDRATPTPTDHRNMTTPKWPRSEAATRRRLRDLCKRKPSLSAHYMRLLRTRSPSPFESSSSSSSPRQQTVHPTPETSTFSSRDLNVSLVAATADSMQSDGPLAQLSKEQPAATPAPAVQRPADWFARIGRSQARSQAHQKSQSLQLGLGLNSWSHSNNSFERGSILASPFDSDLDRDAFMQNLGNTRSLGRGQFNNRRAEHSDVLHSPLDLDGPMPTVRSLKRRFGVDEDSTPQPPLQNLFAAPPTPASSGPGRSRGFSLGDMGVTTPGLASFFTRPPTADQIVEEPSDIRPSTGYLTAPRSQLPPRLGSPFGASSSNPSFNTFPRHQPSSQALETPRVSFEERLRQFSTTKQHN
ncbi:hypothetical protein AAFC00_001119 [Neodothiora populina]|uniref:Uncharacterized protein n=1 Tax=Neodothiora populina TaxID=2781224 RepID=A0ABR3PNV4_9PEZI